MKNNSREVAFFREARRSYHAALLKKVLSRNENGVPSNADGSQKSSVAIADGILKRLGSETTAARLAGQMSGNEFEAITCAYLEETFSELTHLRPGGWTIERIKKRGNCLAQFEQYAHLAALEEAAQKDIQLAAALGNDYMITPDVVIIRGLETDESINAKKNLVDQTVTRKASLRRVNGGKAILHASISCKWTLRSDRAQNARSEALNLIRNRKGRLPHIVLVTGEPSPARLSSIALGTGDVDCVYHFALDELLETVQEIGSDDAKELLAIMTEGKRLKDISDLPLDLAV